MKEEEEEEEEKELGLKKRKMRRRSSDSIVDEKFLQPSRELRTISNVINKSLSIPLST
jgi:hypothetical protein